MQTVVSRLSWFPSPTRRSSTVTLHKTTGRREREEQEPHERGRRQCGVPRGREDSDRVSSATTRLAAIAIAARNGYVQRMPQRPRTPVLVRLLGGGEKKKDASAEGEGEEEDDGGKGQRARKARGGGGSERAAGTRQIHPNLLASRETLQKKYWQLR